MWKGIEVAERILIAYFTHSGNTRKIARLIHDEVGGSVYEIEPQVPYPSAYSAVTEQAKKEIRAGFKPSLRSKPADLESCDVVFVGSPNWWSTIAPPVATFLSECDLAGKTVAPFCTHGGGGAGRIASDIARLCPRSTVLQPFEVYGGGAADTQARVSVWLRRIWAGEFRR